MADKSISELTQATEVTDSDLFVLQQGNVAKKLSGSTLKNYVVLDVVSAEAQTLPAGSDATANYDKANKTLQIGVPAGSTGATGPQGPKGDTGPAGPKGDKGDKGDNTPVKGIDYWTSEDKQEIVQDVLDAMPTWTGGSY